MDWINEYECPKCNCIFNEERVGPYGPHYSKIFCVECGAFIRFGVTPVKEDWIFTFGKHRTKSLETVKRIDPQYLKWLISNGQEGYRPGQWIIENQPQLARNLVEWLKTLKESTGASRE